MAKPFLVEPSRQQSFSDGRPPDWQEREQALDIRQSWIVEAPAGSGKTGLLIQRFLKLLADESVTEPEQVMAITFTVKATSELRERVLNQLDAAANGTPVKTPFDRQTRAFAEAALERDRQFSWGLLERPQRLKIRTIDSVCSEIARALPVLSGSGGQLSPIADATPLYQEAARRTFLQLGGGNAALNDALRTILLHRDGNLADCERPLAGMLMLRDQWGELIPLTGEELSDASLDEIVLPRLERALDQAICSGLRQLTQNIPSDVLRNLTELAAEMGHTEGYKGAPSPIAFCAGLRTAPGETAEHLAHWRALIHLLTTKETGWRATTAKNHLGFEIEKDHARQLKELLEMLRHRDDLLRAIKRVKTLPPAKYPQEQWLVAKALFRILSRALVELQFVFAARGECDFAELGLLARTALHRDESGDDLAAALGMKLQHLLVDEMQDTSTSQYELIELLTQGWDGQSQTAFLVGDPKQSIYLFRQARVERFVRTMQTGTLGELPVGCLRLTANFRSQPKLVEQVNEDFSQLFPREVTTAHPEEVAFVEAAAVRAPTDAAGMVWHPHIIPSGLPTPEAARTRTQQARADAQEIRKIAQQWRARPLPEGRTEPWKLGVLVRSRNHLKEIVAALKQDDGQGPIPFRAVEIEVLGERQEVLDLFALTRALLHSADRVAWLALLHAPWCGLGLADLHLLAGADDPDWAECCVEDLIEQRGDLLSPDGCQRLERVWTVMRAAAKQRSRLTTAQWVERSWRSLGGDAYLSIEELANARRYLQLLDEMELESDILDVDQLDQRLKKLYAQPAVSPGAVDLMTIHGAKGLEWDVVMVPALERKGQSSLGRLLSWMEIDSGDDQAAHVVLAPIAGRGEESKELNAWLDSIHNAREAAERKRLFYVACTRAREELHLFAAPDATNKGGISVKQDSLLKAAWPAAERYFATPSEDPMLLQMPIATDEWIGQIAAGAQEDKTQPQRPPLLHRLPAGFDAGARFAGHQRLFHEDHEANAAMTPFERPEGSFAARAFGNAVHAFIELLTQRIATRQSVASLLAELPQWAPRIASVLRSDGLPPAMVERLASRVRVALETMLQDPVGCWVLADHEYAATERALTSWQEKRQNLRLDRIFRAGPEPLSDGGDCLWIVDFKTTTHGRDGVDSFLLQEREKYAPQMEAYARILSGEAAPDQEIRLMLYYPLIPAETWWVPETL